MNIWHALTFFGEPSISSVVQPTQWSCRSSWCPVVGCRAKGLHVPNWSYGQVRVIGLVSVINYCILCNAVERILATRAEEKLWERMGKEHQLNPRLEKGTQNSIQNPCMSGSCISKRPKFIGWSVPLSPMAPCILLLFLSTSGLLQWLTANEVL